MAPQARSAPTSSNNNVEVVGDNNSSRNLPMQEVGKHFKPPLMPQNSLLRIMNIFISNCLKYLQQEDVNSVEMSMGFKLKYPDFAQVSL